LVEAFIDATMVEARDEARAMLATEGIDMNAIDKRIAVTG